MSSLKPVIHGRDHLPGGSDPIPGLTAGAGVDLPWAFVSRRSLSLASSSAVSTTVDFDMTNNHVEGAEDGSGTFDLQIASGGNNGIRINTHGTFLWSVNMVAQSTSAPAAGAVSGVLSNLDNGDIFSGDYYRLWYTVPGGGSYNGDVSLVGWMNADAANISIPYTALASITQNSGNTITGIFVSFKIVMISSITSPDFT